jgi:phosphate transport system ATP-binding protein
MVAGGLSLAMIMLPIVARTTEGAVRSIPSHVDEAGLALGLPRRRVIMRIVLRSAIPGVLTGMFLALSRVAGEAAPLLFTAFGSNALPTSPLEPTGSLPQLLFDYARQPFDSRSGRNDSRYPTPEQRLRGLALRTRKPRVIAMNVIATNTSVTLSEQTNRSSSRLPRILVDQLEAGFGKQRVLRSISLAIRDRAITAIIGPSGCGKSTFIRCLNRLHEEIPGAWVRGHMRLDGKDLYAPSLDPVELRRRIGMVFQRPNPFPTFSIYENVAVGLRLNGIRKRSLLDERVEQSLRRAALWDEVKDRLDHPGTGLSGGQQQRLCIARALAVEPEILLLDEPCSALDPMATERIEELLLDLEHDYTLVMVTHNIQQAARVANRTIFLLLGEMVEEGPTSEMFTNPKDPRTESYISGRFG